MMKNAGLMACLLAFSLTACSSGAGTAVPMQDNSRKIAEAHARGVWLTSELSAPTDVRPLPPPKANPGALDPQCVALQSLERAPLACGGGSPPAGYRAVSRSAGYDSGAWYSPSVTQYDAGYTTQATFSGDPGYDIRADMNDGTTSLFRILDASGNVALLHPDGTADVIAITDNGDGSYGVDLVQSNVPQSTLSTLRRPGGQQRHASMNSYWCGVTTAAGGFLGGVLLEIAVGAKLGPIGARFSWRVGTFGGAAITGGILYATGVCYR